MAQTTILTPNPARSKQNGTKMTHEISHCCLWRRPDDPEYPKAKDRIALDAPSPPNRGPALSGSIHVPWHGQPNGPKFPHEPEWSHELNPADSMGLADLEIIGPTHEFTHVRCPRALSTRRCPEDDKYPCHADSLVISRHSLVINRNNPDLPTQYSYGAFFGSSGKADTYNAAGRVNPNPDPMAQLLTEPESRNLGRNQGGRRSSGIRQVRRVMGLQTPKSAGKGMVTGNVGNNGCKAKHIVIKSNSLFVVNSVTQHLSRWIGGNEWKGGKIKHRGLWGELVEKTKMVMDAGAAVQFWWVGKKMNREAATLAKLALRLGPGS